MRRRPIRRGAYAVMLVLVFNVLFLAMMGVAFRSIAAALRVESVRALQVERDEGATVALARGLALLDTGLPPQSPYTCGAAVATATGLRSFTVTFTAEDKTTWTVRAAPAQAGENPPPMPVTFAVTPAVAVPPTIPTTPTTPATPATPGGDRSDSEKPKKEKPAKPERPPKKAN